MMRQPIIRTNAAALQRLRKALRTHYLASIDCDHENKVDQAVCACSLINLGWHPSVGAAVESWAQHVEDSADLTGFKLPLGEPEVTCDGSGFVSAEVWATHRSDDGYVHGTRTVHPCNDGRGCAQCRKDTRSHL